MGVTLYRPGNTHVIDGIKCEMKVFDEYLFTSNLETGWHLTPEGCDETEEQETDQETAAETPKEEEAEEDEILTDKEVRAIAKEKGIKYWHNKNIYKLRKEVDEWQPEY